MPFRAPSPGDLVLFVQCFFGQHGGTQLCVCLPRGFGPHQDALKGSGLSITRVQDTTTGQIYPKLEQKRPETLRPSKRIFAEGFSFRDLLERT